MLIDELKLKKEDIYNISSLKEQVFYQFLVEEPMSYPTDNDLAENVQICLSVFCINAPSKRDLIEKHGKTQPKKGFHYTTNLIDLCAMAKDNLEQERDNLMSYCQNNSTRDFYILKHLFSGIFHYPPVPQGSIDQIALHLCDGDFPSEGWKSLLYKALQETSDLHDLYVVEQAYLKAMDDHPIVHRVDDIVYVRDACERFVEKTDRNVKFTIGIMLSLLLVGLCFLIPTIREKWNEVEPIFGVSGIFLIIVMELIIIFRGKVLDRANFTKMFIDKVTNIVFKWKGFNRPQLKDALGLLTNAEEK